MSASHAPTASRAAPARPNRLPVVCPVQPRRSRERITNSESTEPGVDRSTRVIPRDVRGASATAAAGRELSYDGAGLDAEAARFPDFSATRSSHLSLVCRTSGWSSYGSTRPSIYRAGSRQMSASVWSTRQPVWDEARVESFSGAFPGWFGAGSARPGQAVLPPDWKQAMIVLLVLYPTVMILGLILSPRLHGPALCRVNVHREPGERVASRLAPHAARESRFLASG